MPLFKRIFDSEPIEMASESLSKTEFEKLSKVDDVKSSDLLTLVSDKSTRSQQVNVYSTDFSYEGLTTNATMNVGEVPSEIAETIARKEFSEIIFSTAYSKISFVYGDVKRVSITSEMGLSSIVLDVSNVKISKL